MTPEDRAAALRRAEAFGVDLSLLRDNLRRTPTARVERHQRALDLVRSLRAARRLDAPDAARPSPRR